MQILQHTRATSLYTMVLYAVLLFGFTTTTLADTTSQTSATPAQTPAQTPADPAQHVLAVSNHVLAKLQATVTDHNTPPATLSADLIAILEPIVNFASITKAVMGTYYDQATPAQQQQFLAAFKTTLGQLYAKTLVQFKITDLLIKTSDFSNPKRGSLSMQANAANGASYTVTYSMAQNEAGAWQVRNVILDGINLGLTYRNQFYSAAQRHQGNLDAVIANWQTEMAG